MPDFLLGFLEPTDAAALVTPESRTISHAGLRTAAEQVQREIGAIVPAGARVATILPDCAETLLILSGLMTRCSVLPLNPALTLAEMVTIAGEAGVTAVLGDSGEAGALAAALGCAQIRASWQDGPVTLAASAPVGDGGHQAGLVLLTSGSTGVPKRVPLTADQLLTSARTIAGTLSLGTQDRALHALPMFHIGAIVDLFLAPLLAGGSLVICPDRTPSGLEGAVHQGGATWMQLVPTMLARLLAEMPADRLAAMGQGLRFVRSVSSDLAPAQQAEAERALAETPLIQMYGMTETAGQIASNPLPPSARKAGSVGQAAGAEIAILDAQGAPLRSGTEGEICVRGPTVTTGYEASDSRDHFYGPWLRTGDLGYLDDDGFLFLTGRAKEMINRGGEKISPVEVERAALAIDGVREAAAFADPHPTLGEQVALAVVLDAKSPPDEAAILGQLREAIADYKCPRRVQILEAMPRLGSGKINKRALATGRAAPTGRSEWTGDARIAAGLWASILKAPEPSADDDFFDAGGDSLSAMEFLVALEKALGRSIAPTALYDAPRFGAFVAQIGQAAQTRYAGEGDPVFDHLRKRTFGWKGQRTGRYGLLFGLGTIVDKPPLFMCSQGETEAFKAVLHPDRPMYVMPSLNDYRGETPEIAERVAAAYADEIDTLQPEGPLYIAGFCGGARLARTLADTLLARGREIGFLTSIDKWFDRPTPYPVLHIFTENRRHSASQRYRHPELALGQLHPAGAAFVQVEGNHSKALRVDTLRPAGEEIERWITSDAPFPQSAGTGAATGREAAYAADIRLSHPRWFARGRAMAVTVEVTNRSAQFWGPTAESGIAFEARLFNLDGWCHVPHAAYHELAAPLAPSETIRFTVPVRYPQTALPQILHAAMVDQGFAEFAGARDQAVRRLIWANPFSR